MASETLPSASYILSNESSIPFYSTSNGYKIWFLYGIKSKGPGYRAPQGSRVQRYYEITMKWLVSLSLENVFIFNIYPPTFFN